MAQQEGVMSNKQTIVGALAPDHPLGGPTAGLRRPVWRHSRNPIIGWNPIPRAARIFNSAVIPFGGGFVGVFRADHKNGRPQLHSGRSDDGMTWQIENDPIAWVDEQGQPRAHQLRLRSAGGPARGQALHRLVRRLPRPGHRPGRDDGFPALHPPGAPLDALQPQRRAVPTQDRRPLRAAQPAQRQRAYALWRHRAQPQP